jgi:hypothetical protein
LGLTKPVIPSILYNGINEILKIEPPDAHRRPEKEAGLTAPLPVFDPVGGG